jgi:hypothetical protein
VLTTISLLRVPSITPTPTGAFGRWRLVELGIKFEEVLKVVLKKSFASEDFYNRIKDGVTLVALL